MYAKAFAQRDFHVGRRDGAPLPPSAAQAIPASLPGVAVRSFGELTA